MELYDTITNSRPFFLIAGPCVIEDEIIMFKIAETLVKLCSHHNITYIFKASYQKANRTHGDSYTGPGMEKGLVALEKIKKEFNIPVMTDIHETTEAKPVAEVVDILQIPAFLARQTPLIKAAANTGKIINIKKGQFMAAEDMKGSVDKITSENNYQIMLTERGTCFGYHNLVVDFRNFPIMKDIGYPVIYDVTHSLQRPSLGKISGGTPEFVPLMAKAALATGMVDGIFLEAHPAPEFALSDSLSMISLDLIEEVIERLLRICC